MKVLALDGSPREKGCTYTALTEMARELNKAEIGTETLHVGGDDIRGCMGCEACIRLSRCIYNDNKVNEAMEKLKGSDNLVVGSPVHYASAGGAITSSLDRFLYSGSTHIVHKPGVVVASARRVDITVTLDQLNKYFMTSQMPVVSSQYWNMVYGSYLGNVKKDEEGMQITRVLDRNMAWLLQSIEAGEKVGISCPQPETEKEEAGFIR